MNLLIAYRVQAILPPKSLQIVRLHSLKKTWATRFKWTIYRHRRTRHFHRFCGARNKLLNRERSLAPLISTDQNAEDMLTGSGSEADKVQRSCFSDCFHMAEDGGRCPNHFRMLWSTKLPPDLQLRVLRRLPYEDLYRFKRVSKHVKRFLESNPFRGLCLELISTLTTPYFFIASDGTWHLAGYDTSLHRWRRLPPLSYLPNPDIDLFKEYLVCANGGLICINVSKCRHEERLLVFNPLTRQCRELPPLNHRRSPVLMHMMVDPRTQHFKVVVAGSSGVGGLSSITEVFDSFKSEWTVTGNLPGPEFALNEFQSGVFLDGNILCIAFLEPEKKGILAYNVEQGRWSSWDVALPIAPILQLVACGGHVFLFSEQENGCVQFCIDRVESTHLTEVVRCEKPGGGRSLETGPECVCGAHAEFQLCVFNTVTHTGVIYDVRQCDGDIRAQEFLEAPSGDWSGECFYSLNPLSFPLELSVTSQVDTHPP